MQETWRWFGPQDPITLEQIRQAGATGIVSALNNIATGEVWPAEEIEQRKRVIEEAGLTWSVVESVPLHNDIKTRSGDFERMIGNYCETLKNLGEQGIHVVCYNFMPVVDWTRTNLRYTLPDRSEALRFDIVDFAAYDLYVLRRPGADKDYPADVVKRAEAYYESLDEATTEALERNIIAGLPGGEGSYDRSSILAAIDHFNQFDNDAYRQNLIAFLRDITPAAEAAGIKMVIHPDDPPFSLFGLPRVVSTAEDVRKLRAAVSSPSNGLTLCAGSFGARGDNDLVAIAKEFSEHIHFVHLRNIRRESDGSFYESPHLDGDNDIVGLVSALLDIELNAREDGRVIAMRPDHGHTMSAEQNDPRLQPGYSYAGRMKGLAELRGVIHALTRVKQTALG
ncbi:mannonate dehydratase [Congregibacter litoralis]|uniref:Mannonate dehydratase n=1 Tax=Congregibacter litoralis KT71 TaxID=314285 RepID=A4AC69_9GAMM|nr:mannonate dehydratase [Congregibacter litoralis]EAQ96297.1 D-mannonate dehydratase [Congregibacter litoralis KT71]